MRRHLAGVSVRMKTAGKMPALQNLTPRFARGVLLRGLSTRSGDWRPARLRCRRENIRGTESGLATKDHSEISLASRKAAAVRSHRAEKCASANARFRR